MGDNSKISWTDATWNPVTGCSHVSPGCEHCYAETLSLRYGWTKQPWGAQHAAENVVLHPERLDQPLRWKKPRRIFVNSMSDLFHENVPFEFIDQVFTVMWIADHHNYQVLTKRPERMRDYLKDQNTPERWMDVAYNSDWPMRSEQTIRAGRGWIGTWPHENVWLGVSVEDQRRADDRIPLLMETPAAVRFLSCEPLLGPVRLRGSGCDGCYGRGVILPFETPCRYCFDVDWVIAGGESGPQHRGMELDWLSSIAGQCRAAQVPLFVKQDSGPRAGMKGRIPDDLWVKEYPA